MFQMQSCLSWLLHSFPTTTIDGLSKCPIHCFIFHITLFLLKGFISLQEKCNNWANAHEFQWSYYLFHFLDIAGSTEWRNDPEKVQLHCQLADHTLHNCCAVLCHRIWCILWSNNKYKVLFLSSQNKHIQESRVEVLFLIIYLQRFCLLFLYSWSVLGHSFHF